MHTDIAEQLVAQFERGLLSRRQLASRLIGLGAALAVTSNAVGASQDPKGTFQGTGLDLVALDVREVARSRDFYVKHLGLEVIRDGGEAKCLLGSGGDFFLTLFRGDRPGLNHYCYAIKDYDADRAEEKLKAAGLTIRAKATPDDWRRYDTMSLLGGALLGQGRYAEAEPLIGQGHVGLKAREARIPVPDRARLREAAERVVRLYEDWGKPEQARAWKAKVGMPDLPTDVFAGRE
jgi:catechol 2,3-dioxygenase-like lactoylglutathione lyase family enzyme